MKPMLLAIDPSPNRASVPWEAMDRPHQPNNTCIHLIIPTCNHGTWVFDDPRFNLRSEAFVCGASEVISQLSAHIPEAEKGFQLIFAAIPFPGHTLHLKKFSYGDGGMGTSFRHEETQMECWLCPAMLHYFPVPPDNIYAVAKPLIK